MIVALNGGSCDGNYVNKFHKIYVQIYYSDTLMTKKKKKKYKKKIFGNVKFCDKMFNIQIFLLDTSRIVIDEG